MAALLVFSGWYQPQRAVGSPTDKRMIQCAERESARLWKAIGLAVFRTLNGWFANDKQTHTLWGIANNCAFDLVMAAVIALML